MAVTQGSTVKINYVGTLDDGSIFDTTLESDECGCECDDETCEDDDCGCEAGPFQLTLGQGEFFPQIEEALIGMTPGEKKTVMIPAADAFGEYDEEMLFSVPFAELPEGMEPEVGHEYVITNDDDEDMGVVVTAIDAESVSFDANHPLAGEDLHFEVELLEVL